MSQEFELDATNPEATTDKVVVPLVPVRPTVPRLAPSRHITGRSTAKSRAAEYLARQAARTSEGGSDAG